MFVVDVNVLLYAINARAAQHGVARRWLADALRGPAAVAFPWTVQLAFVRLATHRAAFPHPLTAAQAVDVLEGWLRADPAIVIEPTARHLPLLRGLLESARRAGDLVNDAHIAALALEHGAGVVSFDRDFARFEGLRLIRPE